MRSSSLTLPVCWLLLAACCVRRCLALRYSREFLVRTLDHFAESRRDIALVLPMELTLQIRGLTPLDYGVAVDLLLKVISRRRNYLQKYFHYETSTMGYMVSDSRRVSVQSGKFTFYYYAAFVGTSRMTNLHSFMNKYCSRFLRSGNSASCGELLHAESVLLYNLLLLGTFKYLPREGGKLGDMFTDFAVRDGNRTEFVVGRNSEALNLRHLLCHEFLHCFDNCCNMSKILVPWSVTSRPNWPLYDAVFKPSVINPRGTRTFKKLMDIDMNNVLQNTYKVSQSDFGVYRSWCENKRGSGRSPGIAVTLLSCATVLLATHSAKPLLPFRSPY